jgi:TadE-like protein
MRISDILNRKGQSIVEMTLITPLLLAALYVPADFGVAFMTAQLTENAVREAARIGSLKDPFVVATIRNEALSRLPNALKSPVVTPKLYSTGVANCAQFVEVIGQGNYNYFLYQVIRLIGFNVSNTRPISRTARIRYEFQPASNNTPCTS